MPPLPHSGPTPNFFEMKMMTYQVQVLFGSDWPPAGWRSVCPVWMDEIGMSFKDEPCDFAAEEHFPDPLARARELARAIADDLGQHTAVLDVAAGLHVWNSELGDQPSSQSKQ